MNGCRGEPQICVAVESGKASLTAETEQLQGSTAMTLIHWYWMPEPY